MSGKPGRSGTNKGKDKPFKDALRLAISDADNNPRKLRFIAEKLYDMAVAGDVAAIKEIADRLDGKPAQAIIGGDEDDAPISLIITGVPRDGD